MPRPARIIATTVCLGALLTGCADGALQDRVAELEASQNRLRTSLTELGAPDPDDLAARDAVQAEVVALSTVVTELQSALDALRAEIDTASLETDDRLTRIELEADGVAADVTGLQTTLDTLTSRIASLEAQLDSHRDDPIGHS